MRTVSRQTTGLIATLLLVSTLVISLLVHVTARQQRCDTVATDNASLIKFIYS